MYHIFQIFQNFFFFLKFVIFQQLCSMRFWVYLKNRFYFFKNRIFNEIKKFFHTHVQNDVIYFVKIFFYTFRNFQFWCFVANLKFDVATSQLNNFFVFRSILTKLFLWIELTFTHKTYFSEFQNSLWLLFHFTSQMLFHSIFCAR